MNNNNKTIYECNRVGEDVNKTLSPIYYAATQQGAIEYLERNGGGIYKNTLHKFQINVNNKGIK